MIIMKLKFIDSSKDEKERNEDTVKIIVTKIMIFELKELLVDAEMLLTLMNKMMMKTKQDWWCLSCWNSSLMKDEWLNFIKISSEKDDDLNEIIDITLQTVNQWEIFHQRMFFLLIEEIVIVNKVIHVLLQNFTKI